MLRGALNHNNFSAAVLAVLLTVFAGSASADSRDGSVVRAPHYGEALFYFYQQDYFTALNKLQVSREFNRVGPHDQDAELLEGGLLLSWGQHEQAAQIFDQLLAESTEPSVRDRARFYLAKVRYQRGYFDEAEEAFLSVEGQLPVELAAEQQNMLAKIYLEQGRYEEAVAVLADWQGPEIWMVYARYNLGVALLNLGDFEAGVAALEQVGYMFAEGDEELALRDRANLALGFAYLQQQQENEAKAVLRRVSITGPYSNKALLGAGWAASASDEYMQALASWQELSERDLLDSAVQESLLAVPYAYAQLNAEPQAAEAYVKALGVFDAEIARIDQAISEAGDGRLMNHLLEQDQQTMGGWNWKLAQLPDDDRTRYLYFSIADHGFHEALKSYRGLTMLDEHLAGWEQKLTIWRGMLETRAQAHAENWPELQARIAAFNLAGLQESFAELQTQTDAISAEHDIAALAPAAEQAQWRRLNAMEKLPVWGADAAAELQERQRILKGLKFWDLEKEFKVRNWRRQTTVAALGVELEAAAARQAQSEAEAVVIPRQVQEFTARIDALEAELKLAQEALRVSLLEHAEYLNYVATGELQVHRERLIVYRAQARFALAAIYDRMSASNRRGGAE